MPELTDVQKQYMRSEGCPYCKAELEYEEPQMIDGEILRQVYCTNPKCNAEFQETWRFSEVTVDCEPYSR